ncbi:hypothetical protein ROR02_06200 [Pararhodospirillum oryzae]|uniref:Uncharacterized protein n=1 Tax=Pararhodospirillum oryzae TaxID=478448 RepID=A0A512H4U2_9PROT|nr:hypothetical protein ROR02_06200 [Pararhodospirillum oryzae]
MRVLGREREKPSQGKTQNENPSKTDDRIGTARAGPDYIMAGSGSGKRRSRADGAVPGGRGKRSFPPGAAPPWRHAGGAKKTQAASARQVRQNGKKASSGKGRLTR